MKYQHIVWDWNGTLLDDLWLCIESINFILESRGMSRVDKESYKSIFTFPVIKYYEHLGFDFSKEKFPISGFLNYYRNYFKKCNLHQHVHEVLKKNRDKFNVILGMYHDQVLPVLKAISFGESINITLGVPIIRTSVDHGVALDIAGSNNSDTSSLELAFENANNLIK